MGSTTLNVVVHLTPVLMRPPVEGASKACIPPLKSPALWMSPTTNESLAVNVIAQRVYAASMAGRTQVLLSMLGIKAPVDHLVTLPTNFEFVPLKSHVKKDNFATFYVNIKTVDPIFYINGRNASFADCSPSAAC
eukprot:m.47580 g.47580  ORF g.47580 m.47580 type:complete len:135 (+) comp5987_c0_seq3:575-979(+)